MQFTYIDENGQQQTVELPEQLVAEIAEIAEKSKIPFGQAIQQVIASGNFLETVQANGGKVIVEKDNQLREVVREPQAV